MREPVADCYERKLNVTNYTLAKSRVRTFSRNEHFQRWTALCLLQKNVHNRSNLQIGA